MILPEDKDQSVSAQQFRCSDLNNDRSRINYKYDVY